MLATTVHSSRIFVTRAALVRPAAARWAVRRTLVSSAGQGRCFAAPQIRRLASATKEIHEGLGDHIVRIMAETPTWQASAMSLFDQIDHEAKGTIGVDSLSRVVGGAAQDVLTALDVNRDGGDLTRAKFLHFLWQLNELQRGDFMNDMSVSLLGGGVDCTVAGRILKIVREKPRWQATAEQVFDAMDHEAKGTLSVDNFSSLVGSTHAQAVVKAMDVNQDGGEVTRAKFMNLLWHLDDSGRAQLLQTMSWAVGPGSEAMSKNLGARILAYMKMTPAWQEEAHNVFDQIDSTKRGTIDVDDVSTIVGPEQAAGVVQALDVNRDGGNVTRAKFLHFLWQLEDAPRKELLVDISERLAFQQEVASNIINILTYKPVWMFKANKVFQQLDTDKKGTLSDDKLAHIVGTTHAVEVVKALDVNRDGGPVTRAKFLNLLWRLEAKDRNELLNAMSSEGETEDSLALGDRIVNIMGMTPPWDEDAMAAFDLIDHKKAGTLDADAVSNIVGRNYGELVVKALDVNRDGGHVTRAKFLNFLWQVEDGQRTELLSSISSSIAHQRKNAAAILSLMNQKPAWMEHAEKVFDQIDADSSGTLEVSEFEKVVGEKHAEAVVQAMDVNRDGGSVTRAKFMNLLWHLDDDNRSQLLVTMENALNEQQA